MRKRVIAPHDEEPAAHAGQWLDLERIASVEVSSEDVRHPIESALSLQGAGGWRAAVDGEQTIRLIFDAPQDLRRIEVFFEESTFARNQEFTLSWSDSEAGVFREIVRQQYVFSPGGATAELEDFRVQLDGVRRLELRIIPDRGGSPGHASLTSLRVA